MSTERSLAHMLAPVIGVVYLAIGVLGFIVTGFNGIVANGNADFLGFDLNGFHNVVHIVIGAYLILVTKFDTTVTEGALIGGGLVYLLAAFLGFGNHLQILSINSANAADNYLHLVSGAAALLIGLASASRTSQLRRAT